MLVIRPHVWPARSSGSACTSW